MVKIVKFDPKLPTLEETMNTADHINKQGAGPLSQDHLDDILRKEMKRRNAACRRAGEPEAAIEEMVNESQHAQTYSLSNGLLIKIYKKSGKIKVLRKRAY